MGLAQVELDRHDWDLLTCGRGKSARRLVPLLESAIAGNVPGAFRAMDDHALISSILMPPAPAVCAVVMAMLADGVPPDHVPGLAWLISAFAAGEVDGATVDDSLYRRCVATLRDGLWLLYREFTAPHDAVTHSDVDDLLDIVDVDTARLAFHRRRSEEEI